MCDTEEVLCLLLFISWCLSRFVSRHILQADSRDKCGYTPLHLAAMHDEVGAMGVLLEAGVSRELGFFLQHPRLVPPGPPLALVRCARPRVSEFEAGELTRTLLCARSM